MTPVFANVFLFIFIFRFYQMYRSTRRVFDSAKFIHILCAIFLCIAARKYYQKWTIPEKICPVPIYRGGWISRVFTCRNDPHICPKSTLSSFLILDFREEFLKQQEEFQTFCIRSTDIFYACEEGTIYLQQPNVKFEQNRMVRNIQNFDYFWQKMVDIFGKGLMPFWKTSLQHKQLFDADVLLEHVERLSSFIVPKIWLSCNP